MRRARAVEAQLLRTACRKMRSPFRASATRTSWCRLVQACVSRRTAGWRSSSGEMLPLLQRANARTTARAKWGQRRRVAEKGVEGLAQGEQASAAMATLTRNWGCSVVMAFCAAGPAGRAARMPGHR